MQKPRKKRSLDLGEPPSPTSPRKDTGHTSQVQALIREHGPIISVDIKHKYGTTEAVARVFKPVDCGFNVVQAGTRFWHSYVRHWLVAHVIDTPQRQPVDDHARWRHYDDLKRLYTAKAETHFEYIQACRRAAQEAGV